MPFYGVNRGVNVPCDDRILLLNFPFCTERFCKSDGKGAGCGGGADQNQTLF